MNDTVPLYSSRCHASRHINHDCDTDSVWLTRTLYRVCKPLQKQTFRKCKGHNWHDADVKGTMGDVKHIDCLSLHPWVIPVSHISIYFIPVTFFWVFLWFKYGIDKELDRGLFYNGSVTAWAAPLRAFFIKVAPFFFYYFYETNWKGA